MAFIFKKAIASKKDFPEAYYVAPAAGYAGEQIGLMASTPAVKYYDSKTPVGPMSLETRNMVRSAVKHHGIKNVSIKDTGLQDKLRNKRGPNTQYSKMLLDRSGNPVGVKSTIHLSAGKNPITALHELGHAHSSAKDKTIAKYLAKQYSYGYGRPAGLLAAGVLSADSDTAKYAPLAALAGATPQLAEEAGA